jgi:pimeloyl-ACP methyl ester carboxylesterase
LTLAKLPGFDERFADVRGATVRYFVAGAGEPLLLLHGLGGAASNWVELAPALARRRRVLVPDLPGHGGSSPLPAAPNLSGFADRVGWVAEREGMLPAPVVGHSAGALVALRLALRRPATVTALVLAAAAGISSRRRGSQVALEILGFVQPSRLVVPFRHRIARTPQLRYVAFGGWGVADPPALSPAAALGFLDGAALHTDTLGMGRAVVRDDPRPDLGQTRCPCLVLWGATDRWVPLRDGFEYARRLRAPLRVIPDCGHLLIGERPDACLDAIVGFLDGLTPARGGKEARVAYLVQLPEGELTVDSEAEVTSVLRDYVRDHRDDPELANVAVRRLPAGPQGTGEELAPRDFLPEPPPGEQHPPFGPPEDAPTFGSG